MPSHGDGVARGVVCDAERAFEFRLDEPHLLEKAREHEDTAAPRLGMEIKARVPAEALVLGQQLRLDNHALRDAIVTQDRAAERFERLFKLIGKTLAVRRLVVNDHYFYDFKFTESKIRGGRTLDVVGRAKTEERVEALFGNIGIGGRGCHLDHAAFVIDRRRSLRAA